MRVCFGKFSYFGGSQRPVYCFFFFFFFFLCVCVGGGGGVDFGFLTSCLLHKIDELRTRFEEREVEGQG